MTRVKVHATVFENMVGLLITLFLFINVAHAECGFRQSPDQEKILVSVQHRFFAVESLAHYDDGPGYHHHRGLLQLFSQNGEHLNDFKLTYDEDPDSDTSKKEAEVKVICPELDSHLPESSRKKMKDYCINPFTKAKTKTNPSTIKFVLSEIEKILELTNSDPKNNCTSKYSLKFTAASNEYREGKIRDNWGHYQIQMEDPELKTGLSLYRYKLPPEYFWETSLFGCQKNQEFDVLIVRNFTYQFCGGEGEGHFTTIAINKDIIESARNNVLGLRLLKKKDFTKAEDHLEKAIKLDPQNELAHYNLASVIALQNSASKEIESNLKTFIKLTMNNRGLRPQVDSSKGEPDQFLRAELKNKILKDPDFKKVDPKILWRIFSEK